jgi:signal transduction histidine kinase/ActR/RegA family two-component response regulator/HAMP domain-containing protein
VFLGIRAKLLCSFIGLAMLTIVLGGFAASTFDGLNQRERLMYGDVFGGTYLVASYLDRSSDGRAAALAYLILDDPEQRARLRQESAAVDADLRELSREIDQADTDRGDVDTLASVDAASYAFAAWRDRAWQQQDAGEPAAARLSYETEGAALAKQLDDAVGSFLSRKRDAAAQIAATHEAAYESTRRVAVAASIGAAAFALLVGFVLSANVARAARQVAQAARGLAMGDLNQQIPVRSRDELGQMAAAVDAAIAYQQHMARVANAIAARDLSQDVQPKHAGDVLGTAFQRMSANLRQLVGQLQEREQRLQAVLNSVADAVISVDDQGRIEWVNAAAERMFGYAAADIAGQPVEQLIGGAPGPAEAQERIGRRADGSYFPLDLTENRLEVDMRCLSILTVRDATERKHAEQRAQQQIQSEKMRALGQMASGIAHDLNQSLAMISGYGDLARQSLHRARDPNLVQDYLGMVIQAAMDGGETVKRLLAFAQHRTEAPRQCIDVRKLLSEVVQLTAPRWRDASQAEGHHIDLRVDVAGDILIEGWAHSVREALINLVFNAVDAMPQGGTIRLSARRAEDKVVVEVTDTGTGMPPEVQARIFEPFFTTKGERGTGLGLAQVYGIVQRHAGELSVTSTPGHGTTFRLVFPAAAAARPVSQPRGLWPEPAARPLRILAIDDEPALARMVALLLRKQGHQVEVANSGESGLELLEQQAFDLVITDLGLGSGLNGWQVAEQVAQRWPGVRVALATGWGAGIDPAAARERAVHAVVAKPYTADTLRSVVSGIANELAAGARPAGSGRG